jgi:aldehyde dehydrogenase (NAD+)
VLDRFFANTEDYTSVVNQTHFERLECLLKNCISDGGEVVYSSKKLNKKHSFPLTIIRNIKQDNSILKNEIFGPILPIVKYDSFDSVLDFINNNEKSLALYLFSRSRSNTFKFLNLTSSGTVAINECMLQYANPHLPFGGVNNSGIGKTGGKSGFLAFSNEKSVLFQKSGFSMAKFIYPPYTKLKEKLSKFLG